MKNKSEKLEVEDVPVGTWCWLIHHEVILEKSTQPLSDRVEFIRGYKPKRERATRLKWMRPVKGKVPAEVEKAWEVLGEAQNDLHEARKILEKAYEAFAEARKATEEAYKALTGAWKACLQVLLDHREAIEKLHNEECPGCPWDWDEQTLFPK